MKINRKLNRAPFGDLSFECLQIVGETKCLYKVDHYLFVLFFLDIMSPH